jgi:uncharacterized protein with PIN domain
MDWFLARAKIEVAPVTVERVRIAPTAWRRQGQGSGQAARLNFGDGCRQALAHTRVGNCGIRAQTLPVRRSRSPGTSASRPK